MKALIIYDNFTSAAKANAALYRAGTLAGATVLWDVSPWRGDALRLPPVADQALRQEADAHLIVLAGEHVQAFPFWLERWLERWAARRQIQDAALAITDESGSEATPAIVPALSQFARRHGLNFIFNENPSARSESFFFNQSFFTVSQPPISTRSRFAP